MAAKLRVLVAAGQLAARHGVVAGHLLQAPAAPHLPSFPQLDSADAAQTPLGSIVPAGTVVQVPLLAVNVQLWHCDPQAVLQQTPSTQLPDWHSCSLLQLLPLLSLPQLPLTHWLGARQLLLAWHELKHALVVLLQM